MKHFQGHFSCTSRLLLLVSLTTLWQQVASAQSASGADTYRYQSSIIPAPHAGLQRLPLPAYVLTKLQSKQYADIKIINAQGVSVPMALSAISNTPTAASANSTITVQAMPIMGLPNSEASPSFNLRIEDHDGRRAVEVRTPSTQTPAPTQKIVGYLLDTRRITDPIQTLALAIDLPASRPVSVRVHASSDLKDWVQLADTVLYRFDAQSEQTQMTLAGQSVKGQYLRITWADATEDTAPSASIRIHSAKLTLQSAQQGVARLVQSISLPPLKNPHDISFTLPFATPIAALQIQPTSTNSLIPVRILGRNAAAQPAPWTPITSSVVFNIQSAQGVQTNPALEWQGAQWDELKIEADQKTAGFTQAPRINVAFHPVQIVFLASGDPPFQLLYGLKSAQPTNRLPLESLIPGYKANQEMTLPLAQLVAAPSSEELTSPVAAPPPNTPNNPKDTRTWILWAVLTLAVLALASMAYVLMRKMNPSAALSTH